MTSTRFRSRTGLAALAALAVGASALIAAPAHAADLNDPIRFDTGHIDAFNIGVNADGSIRLNLLEDVTGSHVARTPESVELFVKKEAYLEGLPPAYLPAGAPTSLWYLPLTQNPDLIWPGWNSQQAAGEWGSNATVDIVVSEVHGPGDVYLWSSSSFGNPVSLLNDGAWKFPGTIRQNFLAHTHANWGFTAAGTYELTAQATITTADGSRTSTSDVQTYTFIVESLNGDEEPPVDVTLDVTGVRAHYHTGDIVTLTATPSAAVSDHYHWFTRATADDEWQVVGGALTDTYGFIAIAEQDVKAVLYDHDHTVIAESDPVRIAIDDHGNTPGIGPEISVSLSEQEGALVMSVDPNAATTQLSDLTLNAAGDRLVSEGEITGITVTDTRSGSLGWSSSARVRGLVSVDGDSLAGRYLGWTPKVVSHSSGQTVTAGSAIAPGFVSGNGISGWNQLGSAPAGASNGTAVLGADLRIEAPTTTAVGDYSGFVLIRVI